MRILLLLSIVLLSSITLKSQDATSCYSLEKTHNLSQQNTSVSPKSQLAEAKTVLIDAVLHAEMVSNIPQGDSSKVHPYQLYYTDQKQLSQRQQNLLNKHRNTIVQLLLPCIREANELNEAQLRVVAAINDAYEFIPELIALYERSTLRDHRILTWGIGLIRDYKYFRGREYYKRKMNEAAIIFSPQHHQALALSQFSKAKVIYFMKRYYEWRVQETAIQQAQQALNAPKAIYRLPIKIHTAEKCVQANNQSLFYSSKVAPYYKENLKNPVYNYTKATDSVFKQFTALEHYLYSLHHPDSYGQNCNSYYHGSALLNQKIYPDLNAFTRQYYLSKRQLTALNSNRDSIIHYLSIDINRAYIDENFKILISRLQAWECIPILAKMYRRQKVKDPGILTTLIVLMRKEGFPPLLRLAIYKKIHTDSFFRTASYEKYGSSTYYFKGEPNTTPDAAQILKVAEWYYDVKLLEQKGR